MQIAWQSCARVVTAGQAAELRSAFGAVTSTIVCGKLVDVKMFGMFGGFGLGGGTFDSNYRAYPVSFIDKNDAEHADKVFLPPSALDRLGIQLL